MRPRLSLDQDPAGSEDLDPTELADLDPGVPTDEDLTCSSYLGTTDLDTLADFLYE